ncbi:MAG TPA: porin [Roseateles sp.]
MPSFKLLPCCAALLLCASAHAQSSVTVYGLLDVFVEVGHGDGTKLSLEGGGLSGSRLGFKGSEDLGGGSKAVFVLESGLAPDTGTITQGGRFWGRQAFVGFDNSGWGRLTLGRQYAPQFLALDATDPMATGLGSGVSSGIVSTLYRIDNSVAYTAPDLGAFKFTAVLGLGEIASSATTRSRYGNVYNVDARYTAGPLDVGVTWLHRTRTTVTETSLNQVLLSAAYDFGPVKLLGGVQKIRNLTQAAAAEDDRTEAYGGVAMPLSSADTLTASFSTGRTRHVADSRASQWSVGIDHVMSKRTDVYAVATGIQNGDATAYTPAGAVGGGNFPVSVGRNASALQFGIRHRF